MVVAGLLATSGHAASSVWWTNNTAPRGISFAAIDGSTAGNLPVPGAPLPSVRGLAMDLAAGRAYFTDITNDQLRFAKLDGSGVGVVPTPGVTLNDPRMVAVDPAAGRAYIANTNANNIVFVNLNGTGGGVLNTAGATTTTPTAIAVDPVGGRVYFASTNGGNGKISFANLDDSGGQDLNVAGATAPNSTQGIAVDPVGGRVYWANETNDVISFANINGGGGANLNTAGAPSAEPRGIAIDAAGGRIYWANAGATSNIAFARLDNTGGSSLSTLTATINGPRGVTILKTPANTAPPAITGTPTTGQTLTCSDGTWAPDVLVSFLYQSPQGPLTYSWARDGQPVAGQTAKTLVAAQAGSYTCTVTATNTAGSAQALSAPIAVTGGATPTPPAPTPPAPMPQGPTVKITKVQKGSVSIRASTAGRLTVTGGIKKITRTVPAGVTSLRFTLGNRAKRALGRRGRVSVTFTAKLKPNRGAAVTATKTVTIRR